MNRFLAITFVIVISSCYGDALWSGSTFGTWTKGMTPCEICKSEVDAKIVDLKKAANEFLPKLKKHCGIYPTPEGSCDSYVKVFEASYDLLIERQNKPEELCTYYSVCESNSTLDISLPDIPAAPVTPKQIPSKVYNETLCKECTFIVASVTYMGPGHDANSIAAEAENGCLWWIKTEPIPSKEDYKKCYELNSVYFNPITDNILDKTTQNYLCWDLFDVCDPAQKPSELVLPYGELKSTN
ncbi:uncharacterized protein LOC128394212 [Panonychus citri]|uniref:uncharacterized protein LOC128394212 n=1 Tax=Panonychus citri TaxID=50023 RepID=UPI00230785F8|nr:uncharacterized protein LOC128394212 [Panonychus citri]